MFSDDLYNMTDEQFAKYANKLNAIMTQGYEENKHHCGEIVDGPHQALIHLAMDKQDLKFVLGILEFHAENVAACMRESKDEEFVTQCAHALARIAEIGGAMATGSLNANRGLVNTN